MPLATLLKLTCAWGGTELFVTREYVSNTTAAPFTLEKLPPRSVITTLPAPGTEFRGKMVTVIADATAATEILSVKRGAVAL